MRTLVQATPAYQLTVEVSTNEHGHCLKFISYVPTARRPEEQVRFQCVLTAEEFSGLGRALANVEHAGTAWRGSRREPGAADTANTAGQLAAKSARQDGANCGKLCKESA